MKFITSTSSLLKHLNNISGVIGTRTVIPILEYFLFEVEKNSLTITATDLEVAMRTHMEVESKESGKICIPSKMILEILKTLPEQPVIFTIDEKNNTCELTSDNGRYKITGENGNDFPKFPEVDSASSAQLPASVLAGAITATMFSISADELRPAMTGLYVQLSENELKFVSTDGNKLVLYRRTDTRATKEDAFILPKKVLNLLKNALPSEDVQVSMEYNRLNALFTFGDMRLVCRLIDEKFPDYRAAIPVNTPNKLRINRSEMLNALRRTVIFANKSTNQVKLKITGSSLQMFAQDLDFSNEATETLNCTYEGADMEIAFNAKFLIDMLGILLADDVELSLSEFNRPGVLRPAEPESGEDILMLLMPIVLNI